MGTFLQENLGVYFSQVPTCFGGFQREVPKENSRNPCFGGSELTTISSQSQPFLGLRGLQLRHKARQLQLPGKKELAGGPHGRQLPGQRGSPSDSLSTMLLDFWPPSSIQRLSGAMLTSRSLTLIPASSSLRVPLFEGCCPPYVSHNPNGKLPYRKLENETAPLVRHLSRHNQNMLPKW